MTLDDDADRRPHLAPRADGRPHMARHVILCLLAHLSDVLLMRTNLHAQRYPAEYARLCTAICVIDNLTVLLLPLWHTDAGGRQCNLDVHAVHACVDAMAAIVVGTEVATPNDCYVNNLVLPVLDIDVSHEEVCRIGDDAQLAWDLALYLLNGVISARCPPSTRTLEHTPLYERRWLVVALIAYMERRERTWPWPEPARTRLARDMRVLIGRDAWHARIVRFGKLWRARQRYGDLHYALRAVDFDSAAVGDNRSPTLDAFRRRYPDADFAGTHFTPSCDCTEAPIQQP
jgi:hypothetical protein